MSLFPRFTQEISPLFRLLDDYERASRQAFPGTGLNSNNASSLRSFAPKFDVCEVKDAYELHGELPGIEQKNINIEWSDGNTLSISGRVEHHSEKGNPRLAGTIEEAKSDNNTEHYHKPTVEDAGEDGSTSNAVATQANKNKDVTPSKSSENEPKYWVSERSVGEFHRSFSFPARVDQDAVKASLNNGILSIVVPKAKAVQPKKIQIE